VLSLGLDEDGAPMGRWRGQAPDVDGIVVFDREIPTGEIVRATITDAYGYEVEGRVEA